MHSSSHSRADSFETPKIPNHTFPIVEGGNDALLSRLAQVKEVEDLGNGDFRLQLLSAINEPTGARDRWGHPQFRAKPTQITLTVRGDIRSRLQPDNMVFLNTTSVVPKVDDFSKRPEHTAWY
jgi:hypothetical protein